MTRAYEPANAGTRPAPTSAPPARWLQRKCACGGTPGPTGECAECRKERLQRSAAEPPSSVPPIVHEVLGSVGQPLDPATRAFMEPRFGHDFSRVRVHSDDKAAESTQAVGALAYTVGQNVVFGAGRYDPGTTDGKRLLAHELTHVVQQSEQPTVGGELRLDHPASASEKEADSVSRVVAPGRGAPPISSPTPAGRLQRQMGEVKVAERRAEEEARLPARFPEKGIRIIGPDAAALITILSECTGILLTLDADGMLKALEGPVATGKVSPTARAELSAFIKGPVGVIIDTNPAAEEVVIGAFSGRTPGYHRIDVGNIRTMAAASGKKVGLSACDAVMHEISEAVAGRKASLASGATGQQAFEPAHAEGTRVEEAIRTEFGLPLRSKTEQGNMVMMGKEGSSFILLRSSIFGEGRKTFTQLAVLRLKVTSTAELPGGKLESSGDQEVVASHVVEGHVRFTTQRQALEVFNRFASKFGFRPLTIPRELK